MDSIGFLSVAAAFGVDVATAVEERSGQTTAAQADTFPIKVDDQKYLEALGFKFLGPIEGEPLFQRVEMPEGWTKVPKKHPMWTELVDPQGRVRGQIFVNRLDNNAHFGGLFRRFNVGYDNNNKCTYVVGNHLHQQSDPHGRRLGLGCQG